MTYDNNKAEIEEIAKNVLDETGKQGTERFMSFTNKTILNSSL